MLKKALIISLFLVAMALATTPGTPEYFFNQGIDKLKSSDFSGAESDFSRAIDIADDFFDAYFNRGYARMQTGDLSGAAEDFEVVHKSDPTNIEVILALGTIYDQMGDTDNAIGIYTVGIDVDRQNDKFYMGRGLAYITTEQYGRAIEDFTEVIEMSPKNADAYVNRATALYKDGQVPEAVDEYEKALKIDPSHKVARQNYDMIQQSLAAQQAKSNANAGVDSSRVYLNQAGQAYNIGEMATTIRLATKALSFDNKLIEAYIIRGSAFLAQPTYKKAIQDFAGAAKLGSNNPYIYYGMGVAQYSLGELDKAITALGRAIELDGTNADYYLIRGQAYADNGDTDKAVDDYSSAIKFNSNTSKAYHYRGNMFMKLKKLDKAIDDYETSLKMEPNNPIFLSNLATAYISKYRDTNMKTALDKARTHAQKAYDISDGMYGLYNLASAEALANDLKPAFKHLRELLDNQIETPQRILNDYNWAHLHDNEEFKSIIGYSGSAQ